MFDIILATDINYGIEYDFSLPLDMTFFQSLTKSSNYNKKNVIIMGSKTWNTFKGKALADRIHIVITRGKTKCIGVPEHIVYSFEESLTLAKMLENIDNIYIIGGAEIYNIAFHHSECRTIYHTFIKKDLQATKKCLIPEYKYKDSYSLLFNDIEIYLNRYSNIKFSKNGEYQYLNLLQKCLSEGEFRQTRNAETYSIFSEDLKFNLKDGFPLLTTKKMYWKAIVEELLFFIKGYTNSKILSEKNVKIWDQNTTREFLDYCNLKNYEIGDMGPMYGFNWRYYGAEYKGYNHDYSNQGIDQLKNIINEIKTNPTSRRICMTTLDLKNVDKCVLWPCHGLIIQFYVVRGKLSCKMYQRSADLFLGLPFNIASYALLTHLIAKETQLDVGDLYISLGDCHIYSSHKNNCIMQSLYRPLKFPTLLIKSDKSIFDYTFNDLELQEYVSYPSLKADMYA